jgi:hypothetical protein
VYEKCKEILNTLTPSPSAWGLWGESTTIKHIASAVRRASIAVFLPIFLTKID